VVLANGRLKCGACDFGGSTELVHLVGVSISLEKNFYRLPFTPPSLVAYLVLQILALCLRELGSLLSDDVLYLSPLTTSHGEAGLPTSMAQQRGLREIGAQGGV
jgi:hypothetical protein